MARDSFKLFMAFDDRRMFGLALFFFHLDFHSKPNTQTHTHNPNAIAPCFVDFLSYFLSALCSCFFQWFSSYGFGIYHSQIVPFFISHLDFMLLSTFTRRLFRRGFLFACVSFTKQAFFFLFIDSIERDRSKRLLWLLTYGLSCACMCAHTSSV